MPCLIESKPDEITTFLGEIPPEEYALRDKMRSYRNAASQLTGNARSDTARQLAWATIEWASPNLYNPAPVDWLAQVNRLCRRLLLTAMQAEDMALALEGASDE